MLSAQRLDDLGDRVEEWAISFVNSEAFFVLSTICFLTKGASLTKLYDWIVLLVDYDLYP